MIFSKTVIEAVRKYIKITRIPDKWVSDLFAGLAIVAICFLAFGGLLNAPSTQEFGEGTSFYGTPNLIARDAIKEHGFLPIWDFRTGAGDPLHSNPLATQFYPFSLLGFLSENPALDGIRWMTFAHFLVAGFAIYIFVRGLGVNPIPALLAPSAYILNAHNFWQVSNGVTGQIFALSWVPIGAWLLLISLRRRSLVCAIGAGVCFSMLILAGTVYDLYFAGIIMAIIVIVESAYIISQKKEEAISRILAQLGGLSAIVVITMIGVSAVKLLPVMEYQPISTRMAFTLEEAQVSLENIPTFKKLLVGSFRHIPASAIPGANLVLFLFAIAAFLKPTRIVTGLGLMVVISIWASLGQRVPLDLYAFFYHVLPGFKFNNTTIRFMNIFYFAYPVLAAIGANTLIKISRNRFGGKGEKIAIGSGVFAVTLLAVSGILPMQKMISQTPRATYEPEPVPGSFNDSLVKMVKSQGDHTFRVYSTYIFRLDENTVNPLSAETYGYDLVNPTNQHMVSKYQFMPYFGPEKNTFDRSQVLLSILNARYFAFQSEYDFIKSNGEIPFVQNAKGAIYENKKALKRAQVIPRSILLIGEDFDEDFNSMEARLIVFHPKFDPQRVVVLHGKSFFVDDYDLEFLHTFDAIALTNWSAKSMEKAKNLLEGFKKDGGKVVTMSYKDRLEKNPFRRSSGMLTQVNPPKILSVEAYNALENLLNELNGLDGKSSSPDVKIISYKPSRMVFQTGKNDRHLPFVFSQTFYPGWNVSIDGKPAELFMADSLINGIMLPPGNSHTIVFQFSPKSFFGGLTITSITLVVIGVVFWKKRQDLLKRF